MSFFGKALTTLGGAMKNKQMDIFIYGAATAFVVCGILPARGIDNDSLKNSPYAKQYLTKYYKDDSAENAKAHH